MDIDHGKCSHEHPPKIKNIYIYSWQIRSFSYLILLRTLLIYDHPRNIFATFSFYWLLFGFIHFNNILKRIAQLFYFKIFVQCTVISSFY